MLILFDIDATLISTSGAGIRAMGSAGRALYKDTFTVEGVLFSGRLDGLIIADLLTVNGVDAGPDQLAAFRRAYREHLITGLAAADPSTIRALPGVTELLAGAANLPGACIGLLTGNFEETGRIKLTACGIDADAFRLHVWGDESPSAPPTRDDLPRVAMDKYRRLHARDIDPASVTIIGDTPHDVRCAKVNGCRVLAVATGRFSVDELRAAGADAALGDLSDSAAVLGWLTG